MSKRTLAVVAIAAITALSCLALTGCGVESMDEDTRKSVGIAIGILIIAASGLGVFTSRQYFGRKRLRNQSRKRSSSKKRR